MKKAIDVSKYQGIINWDEVKASGVEFAIIRGGLGDDIKSQDDEQFDRNWNECQRVGIPCTMYFFSYAAAKNGDISSELAHIKRLMNGKAMNSTAPIYIDVENTSGLNWRSISNQEMLDIFKRYKEGLAALGYGIGIYSSRSAFWNEKMTDPWYAENVSIWVAEYDNKVNNFTRPYDLWQYSSSGSVPGIRGRVDMDWLYADFAITKEQTEKEEIPVVVTYQAYAKGRWLPNVENKSDYAGIFGEPISGVYASADHGDLIYRVGLVGGNWLPEVKNREDYAGILGNPIDRIMIKSLSGNVVHVQAHADGRWLPAVTGYDQRDAINGYAGIIGKPIDGIFIWADPIVKEKPIALEPIVVPDPNPPSAVEEVQRLEDQDDADESIVENDNQATNEKAEATTDIETNDEPANDQKKANHFLDIIIEFLHGVVAFLKGLKK